MRVSSLISLGLIFALILKFRGKRGKEIVRENKDPIVEEIKEDSIIPPVAAEKKSVIQIIKKSDVSVVELIAKELDTSKLFLKKPRQAWVYENNFIFSDNNNKVWYWNQQTKRPYNKFSEFNTLNGLIPGSWCPIIHTWQHHNTPVLFEGEQFSTLVTRSNGTQGTIVVPSALPYTHVPNKGIASLIPYSSIGSTIRWFNNMQFYRFPLSKKPVFSSEHVYNALSSRLDALMYNKTPMRCLIGNSLAVYSDYYDLLMRLSKNDRSGGYDIKNGLNGRSSANYAGWLPLAVHILASDYDRLTKVGTYNLSTDHNVNSCLVCIDDTNVLISRVIQVIGAVNCISVDFELIRSKTFTFIKPKPTTRNPAYAGFPTVGSAFAFTLTTTKPNATIRYMGI